jgi:hypothetical protein
MGKADDGRLRHLGMRHERAFRLGRAEPVPGDVDDILDPPVIQ